MKIHCKYDKLVDAGMLKAHPKNRNKHPDAQIKRLAKILTYQGLRAPIVVSKLSGFVVKGHGTMAAAIMAGFPQLPVVFQEFESTKQEYLFLQSDNSIAAWASLDLDGIGKDLVELGDIDIELLGFDNFEMPNQKGECDEDATPEIRKTSIRMGDCFALGSHRILCGDSTKPEEVARLMNGEKADFCFTSPPYNVGLDYNSHDDSMSVEDYKRPLIDVIKNIKNIASADFAIFWNKGVWIHPCDFHLDLEFLEKQFKMNRVIAWKKKGITGPPIFAHTQKNPVTKNYMPFFGWEFIFICKQRGKGKQKIPNEVLERRRTDVWEVDQSVDSSNQAGHPGAFPVQLVSDSIYLFADQNVYEPFCGSGTTLIACEKTNRKCYGMEIDPQYCQVIIDRWEKFTGKKAEKLDGKTKEKDRSRPTEKVRRKAVEHR